MLPTVSLEGGLVADPELAFSGAGKAWARCRVACKDRKNENGSWVDGESTFIDVVCFGKVAENLTESASRGDTITVQGHLKQRDYEVDGVKRTSYQVVATSVGVSLTWNPAKTERTSPTRTATAEDPWASKQAAEPPW